MLRTGPACRCAGRHNICVWKKSRIATTVPMPKTQTLFCLSLDLSEACSNTCLVTGRENQFNALAINIVRRICTTGILGFARYPPPSAHVLRQCLYVVQLRTQVSKLLCLRFLPLSPPNTDQCCQGLFVRFLDHYVSHHETQVHVVESEQILGLEHALAVEILT